MANSCPNHNDEAYKLLEENLGKETTYAIFILNGELLPTLEAAQQIVNIHLKSVPQKVENEVDNITKEISESVEKSEIVKIVDEYYTIISNHLRNLRERKSYAPLKKVFITEEGVNKLSTLQDILIQAKKLQDKIEDDFRNARSIAQTIVAIDHFVDFSLDNIKEIIKNTDDSIENLHTLQSYLNTLNDWNILLDEANKSFAIGNPSITKKIGEIQSKIRQVDFYIAKNDESGVVKKLQEILIPASKELIQSINSELVNQKTKLQRQVERKADQKTIQETKKVIKSLEDKIQEIDFENTQNVIDFLKGKRGDAGIFNTWLESFRDSSDPTIAAFTTFIKHELDKVANKVYKIDLQYQKELQPLVKESERLNPASLTEKITFKDQILQDGERTEVLSLLHEWGNGYRADYSETIESEQKAKEDYLNSNSEEDKEIYLSKRKERQKFEQDYLYTEFLPEVYEKYKLFETPIGQKLKLKTDAIYERLNEIDAPYKLRGEELSEDDIEEKDALISELKLLGSIKTLDGDDKTGEELEMAKLMQKIRALNRQFYVWKDNNTQFEKAKQRHSEYIISKGIAENSPEYTQEMEKWTKENTRTVILEEFYDKRTEIIEGISDLLSVLKTEEDNSDFQEVMGDIISQVYGHRDEDGQPVGTEITQKATEKIKAATERLEEIKASVQTASGLSKNEQARVSELYEKVKDGSINSTERQELTTLNEKKKTNGLSKSSLKKLGELIEELNQLQSKIPTEYYVDSFNALSQKEGVIINEVGQFEDKDILKSEKLDELLKNEEFRKWFEDNHIQVLRYNRELQSSELQWERLYQWNRIVPNDKSLMETKPSLKYSYREIKPEYKTPRVIGETIDNKGNWLPNPDKPLSAKYRNQKYFNLINSKDSESQRLSKILDIHKKHLLTPQEDLARNNRLYLDVPRVEREGYEQNLSFVKKAYQSPGSIPKLIWQRILETYHKLTSYNVQDDVRYESPFDGKYDKDFIKVPMKYTGKLDVNEVSLDLYRNISKYTYSAELNKQLVETLPIARALDRVITRADEHRPSKKQQSNRIRAIRRIILREFEGQKSNLDIKKLPASQEKQATAIINLAKYLAVWSTIKINIPAAIANVVNAEAQNTVNMGNEIYSAKSYGKSAALYATRFFPKWQRDYIVNKLGDLSLESQLFDVWEPIQGITVEEIVGEKSSQSKLYDAIGANWLFNLREWGEKYVQSRTWLSALYETKVDYNGTTISLVDAYELDSNGIIKLKDGIDPSWEVGGKQFQRLKDKVQTLNRRIHGNYAAFDKTQAEMFAIGSLALFLKRFFISMAANRFAYGDSIHEGRFNINTGHQYGYYTQTASIVTKQLKSGLKDWDLLTIEEKRALVKTAIEMGVIFGALALMAAMGYSGDDKNKKEKLKNYSWLELNTLYQLDRLFVETSSFINPKSYFDYTVDLQIKNALEKWYKLLTDIISQEEYKSTLKSSDGNIIYKAGDKKWKTQLKRAIGLQQMLLFKEDPDYMLQTYDKTVRSR